MDGKKLKFARHLAGLSQKQLGQSVGLGRTTITKYEAGEIKMSQRTHDGILEVLASHGIGHGELISIENIMQNQSHKRDGTCPYCNK